MIIKISAHKTSTNVVVIHATSELAAFMGAFPAARWQPKPKVYWLEVDQLETFTRYARIKGHVVVDDREAGPAEERFVGPLPECSACGAPASRRAAQALSRCPSCGAEWRPTVFDQATPHAPKVECPTCGRRQKAGHAYCGGCGSPASAPPTGAPRPYVEAPRVDLEEPLPFTESVPEHLAEGLAEHDERDYAQRAAGDR